MKIEIAVIVWWIVAAAVMISLVKKHNPSLLFHGMKRHAVALTVLN
jgi:hypothetical protein